MDFSVTNRSVYPGRSSAMVAEGCGWNLATFGCVAWVGSLLDVYTTKCWKSLQLLVYARDFYVTCNLLNLSRVNGKKCGDCAYFVESRFFSLGG